MEHVGISEKVQKALENGLLIAYRIKNHSLDYSIMNRPEPTLSGVSDHLLATAIVYAGNKFKIVIDPKTGTGGHPEKVSRSDGRTVTYSEFIDIDWQAGTIQTTRRGKMLFTVLEAVAGQLIANAKVTQPKTSGPAN